MSSDSRTELLVGLTNVDWLFIVIEEGVDAKPVSYTHLKRLQIEQLEKENEILVHKIADKQAYLERLQQNPDELSLEIKRRLMLVNPGSKSFILQDGTKPAPQRESGTGR